MSFKFIKKGDFGILLGIFGHAAIGFMFGTISVMIPWVIIVAPQIVIAHSADIYANNLARPIGFFILATTIIWHVSNFLKQFGLHAIWYGFLAAIISTIGAIPFFLYSSIVGSRSHRPSLTEIFETVKHPGEIIHLGLIVGLGLGVIMLVSGIIGVLLSRRKT